MKSNLTSGSYVNAVHVYRTLNHGKLPTNRAEVEACMEQAMYYLSDVNPNSNEYDVFDTVIESHENDVQTAIQVAASLGLILHVNGVWIVN